MRKKRKYACIVGKYACSVTLNMFSTSIVCMYGTRSSMHVYLERVSFAFRAGKRKSWLDLRDIYFLFFFSSFQNQLEPAALFGYAVFDSTEVEVEVTYFWCAYETSVHRRPVPLVGVGVENVV